MRRCLYTCYTCILLAVLLLGGSLQAYGQQFRVANNRMVIELPEGISETALDSFLKQYNLEGIGIKEFMLKGDKKILLTNGWQIAKGHGRNSFSITKLLATSADLLKPLDKAVFKEVATPPNWQQREGNRVIFGVNEFTNGKSFTIHDSIIDFFLRGFQDAEKVRLAGSFTNWQHGAFPMTKTDSGWVAHVKLNPGKYYYKFIADEDGWTTDPDNDLEENDGQGNTNSVFFVTNHVFSLPGHTEAQEVFLSGSFNEWDNHRTAMQRGANGWLLPAFIGEGTHAYQFIIDKKPSRDTFLSASGPRHRFMVKGNTNARSVTIEGSFNSWKAGGNPMIRTAGGWILDYALGAGNYTYHARIDGNNQADSFLVIGANYTFRLRGYADAKKVNLAGDFNDWNPQTLTMHRVGNEWVCSVYLAKGKHLYKFIVDGNWIRDPASNTWEDAGNSVLWINE